MQRPISVNTTAAGTERRPAVEGPVGNDGAALHEKVAKIINLIRPVVQSDGGDVELLGVTGDGVVQIRLHGACVGCPSSQVTLKSGIERNLRDHCPEIKGVRSID